MEGLTIEQFERSLVEKRLEVIEMERSLAWAKGALAARPLSTQELEAEVLKLRIELATAVERESKLRATLRSLIDSA